MGMVTVRVDEEIRRKMKELKHVNWSEVIRDAIRSKIEEEKGSSLAKAVLITERLRRKGALRAEDVIRRLRDERYGAGSAGR